MAFDLHDREPQSRGAFPLLMGPIHLRTSIVFDSFPWTMFTEVNCIWPTSAHYFNVPADCMRTVHPPLKSIAVVYEYTFPLLLANKTQPFLLLLITLTNDL
jgi:hypothetical protein